MSQPEKKIDDAWKKKVDEEKKKEGSFAPEEVSESAEQQVSHRTEEGTTATPSHKVPQSEGEEAESPPLEAESPPLEAESPSLEANFGLFLSGFGMQALISLGEIENPITKKKQIDLNQAKYVIDTIQMLKEKTQGNLNEEEVSLIDELLYQLRMKYVAVAK